MYSVFNSHGIVRQIDFKTSKQGNPYAVMTIQVGEYQNQPEVLELSLAGKSFQFANGINQGDEVAVSGFLRSKRSNKGFMNLDVMVTSVVVTRKGQQQPQYQQPQDQGYQQQMNAYADQQVQPYNPTEIPF